MTPVCRHCWDEVQQDSTDRRCQLCAKRFPRAEALDADGACGSCVYQPPAYDRLVHFGDYAGSLRRLIHLLKYDRMRPLGRGLGRRLAEARQLAGVDCVAPVPLHWRRRRERGFNQAELLARQACRRWGLPLERRLLDRVKPTDPQAGRTRADRLQNVRGAFRVRDRSRVVGRRIALVDDVMTTGATLNACARKLKQAGATAVIAVALARADLEKRVI